jgi:hypothetical protein
MGDEPRCRMLTGPIPCGRVMTERRPRPGIVFDKATPAGVPFEPASPLYACGVHDGAAASPYQTNPHFNRPRKDDQS